MSKNALALSLLISGVAFGVLQYKLKPSPDDKEIAQYSQGMALRTEWQGRIAPDFETKTLDGEPFRLSDNIGKKIIVLNFFATWCGPCREEMPELNRYFNAHKADSFLLLAIDAEEKEDRVREFLKDLKVNFPAGIDDGPIQKRYGVSAFPTTVLIGVDGKVQFYEAGALANAEVAFDNLLSVNRELVKTGKVISLEEYLSAARQQPSLPQAPEKPAAAEEYKFDERGKRIVARMDCPCGCDKKVEGCTCNTSNKIKKALTSEDFASKPDDEIIRGLNKRFCSGGM